MSGDTALVGVGNDDAGGTAAGAAYVFVHNGTTWSEQQKLTASDAVPFDWFGRAVALSGDTALIGANSESAYVFVRSGTSWVEQQKLTASDPTGHGGFGASVALRGDTALIGSYLNDASGPDSGAAYVFTRSGTTWSEQIKLVASDAEQYDFFGYDVALAGDTAVIGAPLDDHAVGYNEGSAYVFVRLDASWVEQQKLLPEIDANALEFGRSVAASGDTAAVRGFKWGQAKTSTVHVFVRSGSTWSLEQQLTPGDGGPSYYPHFGTDVALFEDILVASVPQEGVISVYERSGTTWSGPQTITALGVEINDWFGGSVAVEGDTLVAGAQDDDHAGGIDAGSAYVFQVEPPPLVTYCTAGTSASGCQALLSAIGTPSASAASGFVLQANGVEGTQVGLFFWGTHGKQANPWGNGTSLQCVVPPVTRGGLLAANGTIGACDGTFPQDLNALWCPACPSPQKNPGANALVHAQFWYRDQASTSNKPTSLSNAIEFLVAP